MTGLRIVGMPNAVISSDGKRICLTFEDEANQPHTLMFAAEQLRGFTKQIVALLSSAHAKSTKTLPGQYETVEAWELTHFHASPAFLDNTLVLAFETDDRLSYQFVASTEQATEVARVILSAVKECTEQTPREL